MSSAVYDPATDSVTLTATTPFIASRAFKFVRVFGSGPNALLTSNGQPIDGDGNGVAGGDTLVRFFSFLGKQLTYRDVDGDLVSIRLKGPGRVNIIRRRTGSVEPIVFVTGASPTTSILSGVVRRSRLGDGHAVLQEVSGVSAVQDDLTTSSQFTSLLTEP